MPQLPWTQLACDLNDAVLGLAEAVENAFEFEVQSEGQAGEAIDENAVVDVSAGGVVTGKGGGTLPDLTAAAGVLVVAIAQGLMSGNPEALEEKECEQPRRNALRTIDCLLYTSRCV